jgi:hypothetical protein
LASPVKETAGFQGLQKCGGEKAHKGRSPTAGFRSPSRFSGEAYTDLLCAGFLLYLLYVHFYYLLSDNNLVIVDNY